MDKDKMSDAFCAMLKRLHDLIEAMLVCVRRYATYPLSLRQIEEMMTESRVVVDHVTIHRWSIKMMAVFAAMFLRHKRPVGTSSCINETYIMVTGG